MAKLVIRGGRPLKGVVRVGGRKNSAVAVLPAALLASKGSSVIENLPDIRDVRVYLDILRHLGAEVEVLDEHSVRINATRALPRPVAYAVAKKMRATYYLVGALLARFGEAEIAMPGGCDIGLRPIDQHIKGLTALEAEVTVEAGVIKARAERLVGTTIYLDVVSVGATINIMLAASLAEGTTVLENAAREPHVVDLANYLNAMGARVVGAGTDVIKIRGAAELRGSPHAIIPDEIEAATYMIATVGTGGEVVVENVIPKHLEPITAKLREMGAEVIENGDWIKVRANGRPKAANIKTLPYPGFPTDAQQPMTALLAVAEGTSLVTETVWESRFRHVDELNRMGTNIRVEGRTAIVEGVEGLTGTSVAASDLRAGAALVVAGLIADGVTEIEGIEHIDRGYERIVEKLRGLGAELDREE